MPMATGGSSWRLSLTGENAVSDQLTAHPAAAKMPKMTDDEFAGLVADIGKQGLQVPIILHRDGSILDGVHRYNACQEAGVEPLFMTWDGEGDPTWFVNSMNAHRRHFTKGQRHMIAARVAAQAQQDKEISVRASVTAVSKELEIGERGVYQAKIVIEEGTEEEIADCDSGKASPQTTAKKIRARNKPPKTGAAVPPPKPKARTGSRIPVPEGKTAENLCREAMDLEKNNDTPAKEAAKATGLTLQSYRQLRSIVLLSDVEYLTARDQAIVTAALADVNEHSQVLPNYEKVKPIIRHLWGKLQGAESHQKAQSRRMENFQRALAAITNVCNATAHIDVPYLTPQQLEETRLALTRAGRNITSLKGRITDLHE